MNTLGQLGIFPNASVFHLTYPPPSSWYSQFAAVNPKCHKPEKSKVKTLVSRGPESISPSKRYLPIESQIRRRQPRLLRSLSFSSAPSDPLPPPLGEALAASLHPVPKGSIETVAGASLELRMELLSPQLPPAAPVSSSSSPRLKGANPNPTQQQAPSSEDGRTRLVGC